MRIFLGLLWLFTSIIHADLIDEKVRSLVDPKSYIQHQRLIEIIFKDRKQFYIDEDRLDSVKIVTTLKDNGLLDIFYKGVPKELKASFRTVQSPNFFLKAIKDSLSDLGYNFTIISSVKSQKLFFEWTISYRSDHAIDPALLFKRVASYGIKIDDITKNGDDWFYALSLENLTLPEAVDIKLNGSEPELLLVPSGEYWAKIPTSAIKISVKRRTGAIWFPYIAFYDQDFKIISVVAHKEGRRTKTLKVPNGAKFIKITDNYTTENLKHGILLWAEGKK